MQPYRTALQFLALFFVAIVLGECETRADDESPVRSLAEIRAVVDSLHVEETPWREIAWRTCLVEGVNESRQSNKPLILWMFIDRPIDDERC